MKKWLIICGILFLLTLVLLLDRQVVSCTPIGIISEGRLGADLTIPAKASFLILVQAGVEKSLLSGTAVFYRDQKSVYQFEFKAADCQPGPVRSGKGEGCWALVPAGTGKGRISAEIFQGNAVQLRIQLDSANQQPMQAFLLY